MNEQIRNVEIEEAQRRLADLVGEVGGRGRQRIALQRDGKTVAAIVSAIDLERLAMLDRRAAEGWRTIEEIWARNADIDPEEAERDIAEAIAEVRAEARARKSPASHA